MPTSELPNFPDHQPIPDVHQQIKDFFDERTVLHAVAASRQDMLASPTVTRAQQERHAAAALNAIDELNLRDLGKSVASPESSSPLPQRRPARGLGDKDALPPGGSIDLTRRDDT